MAELDAMTSNINKVLRVGKLSSTSSVLSNINPVRVSTLLGDCQIRQIIGRIKINVVTTEIGHQGARVLANGEWVFLDALVLCK